MTIIATTIFITALMMSVAILVDCVSTGMVHIATVIDAENHVPAKNRIITVGPLQSLQVIETDPPVTLPKIFRQSRPVPIRHLSQSRSDLAGHGRLPLAA